jgi:hypothetical protein
MHDMTPRMADAWVYDSGVANRGSAGASRATGSAHSGQNFAVGESWVPQFAQVWTSGAAHSSQNVAWARFSCWHRGHFNALRLVESEGR